MAVEELTPQSSQSVVVLSAGQVFLLGDWMADDNGPGFVEIEVSGLTLMGEGSGATLDAQRRGRMFHVTAGNLTLTNLHLVNGLAQACITPLRNYRPCRNRVPAHGDRQTAALYRQDPTP